MKLRPHHMLCIQKFTGHGYNEAFTAHMTSIVSKLRNSSGNRITITQGCDDLCEKCPHNLDGVCASLDKVALMDSMVLDICGLSYGDKILWTESARKARERIFKTDQFEGICGSCQWFELCKNTEVFE